MESLLELGLSLFLQWQTGRIMYEMPDCHILSVFHFAKTVRLDFNCRWWITGLYSAVYIRYREKQILDWEPWPQTTLNKPNTRSCRLFRPWYENNSTSILHWLKKRGRIVFSTLRQSNKLFTHSKSIKHGTRSHEWSAVNFWEVMIPSELRHPRKTAQWHCHLKVWHVSLLLRNSSSPLYP